MSCEIKFILSQNSTQSDNDDITRLIIEQKYPRTNFNGVTKATEMYFFKSDYFP